MQVVRIFVEFSEEEDAKGDCRRLSTIQTG